MGKKRNRSRSKPAAKPASRPAIEASEPEVAPPPAEPRAAKGPKLSRSQAAAERLEEEYAFITTDLRRVFILAAAMFALLIALNVIFALSG